MFSNGTEKSIKVNFIMNMLLTLSSIAFPLITFPYASRILLPEGIGKVAMGTSVIAYFSLIARLGIPTYGIRACARVRDDKYKLSRTVHELLVINLIMAIISYVVLFIIVFTIPKFKEEYMLYLLMSISILLEALGVEWFYKALEEYSYITIRSIFCKLIALGATFLFVHTQQDYIKYGVITIMAVTLSNLLNFCNLRKYIIIQPLNNYSFKKHLKPIIYLFASSCVIIIYTQMNTVILGLLKTNVDVGLYDTPMKIKNVLVGIVTTFGAVLIPRASYYIRRGLFEDFYMITKKSVQFVCFLALPLISFFIVFASNSIFVLAGDNFIGAVIPFKVILISIFFIGLTNIIGLQILVPLGKEKCMFYSGVGGGFVDLIACFLLIPILGPTGAAISNLLAELTVLIIQYHFAIECKKIVDIKAVFASVSYYKIIIAIGVSLVASSWCKILKWGDFLVLLISSIIFFGVYCIVLYVMEDAFFIGILTPIKIRLKKFVKFR